MATRSQRRKEKQRKKRQEKKKAQQRSWVDSLQRQNAHGPSVSSPHTERLARQVPKAWDNELPEDVAVFDDHVLQSLPPDLGAQVTSVREALELAGASHGEPALKAVASIPRSSPLSEWRLFVRGLVAWMADDLHAAGETWQRLDADRRPGRIAAAMMCSLRSDLDRIQPHGDAPPSNDAATLNDETATGEDLWSRRLDERLLYHAKLLRRVRIERTGMRIAEAGVRIPEEINDLTIGPKKIGWLKDFAAEFRATEPHLVAALERTAMARAFAQNYSDVFEVAVKSLKGPPHDRANFLFRFFYYMTFKDSQSRTRSENSLKAYLTSLPKNEEISESLRRAIASQIHVKEAIANIAPTNVGMFGMFMERENPKVIRKHFEDAVRAYPSNRSAYQEHVEWLEAKLENDRLTKSESEPILIELAGVRQAWTEGLPDDIEPRLWLANYFLENDQTDAARPHIDWLSASRHDDPRVRAFPWKWQLLEAMRLCRRKAWLNEVPAYLAEAEAKWPAWLSRQWLPYLHAAWLLRCGKRDEYEVRRGEICASSGLTRDSLPDACMMLAAAQRLNVPAGDLKPLRVPVDDATKKPQTIALDELLAAAVFFWDLHRTEMLYPAYARHGSKLAKELFRRLKETPQLVIKSVEDERIHAAVLWFSEHRFFGDGYDLSLPKWYSRREVKRHPMFVAAHLNARLKLRSVWRLKDYSELPLTLRESASSQRDAFYRYWFGFLAEKFDEVVAKKSSPFGGIDFDAFESMFDRDDDDDDDIGFDPDCDCPACTAARRQNEASRR